MEFSRQEWVAFLFSRRSSQPRDRTQASCTQVASLPAEPPGSPGREEGTCSSLGPLLGPRAGHALTGSCTSHGSLQPEAMPLLASFSGWVEECDSFNKGVSRGPVRGYLGKQSGGSYNRGIPTHIFVGDKKTVKRCTDSGVF